MSNHLVCVALSRGLRNTDWARRKNPDVPRRTRLYFMQTNAEFVRLFMLNESYDDLLHYMNQRLGSTIGY